MSAVQHSLLAFQTNILPLLTIRARTTNWKRLSGVLLLVHKTNQFEKKLEKACCQHPKLTFLHFTSNVNKVSSQAYLSRLQPLLSSLRGTAHQKLSAGTQSILQHHVLEKDCWFKSNCTPLIDYLGLTNITFKRVTNNAAFQMIILLASSTQTYWQCSSPACIQMVWTVHTKSDGSVSGISAACYKFADRDTQGASLYHAHPKRQSYHRLPPKDIYVHCKTSLKENC
jgi:hypothetical protein